MIMYGCSVFLVVILLCVIFYFLRKKNTKTNENPLANGRLYTFEVGTNNLKHSWSDEGETIPNRNPVILNPDGTLPCPFHVDNNSRIIVTDENGKILSDKDLYMDCFDSNL